MEERTIKRYCGKHFSIVRAQLASDEARPAKIIPMNIKSHDNGYHDFLLRFILRSSGIINDKVPYIWFANN